MDEQDFERKIEIFKREYSGLAPKAAERSLKLDFLRLTDLPLIVDSCLREATETYTFGKFLASIAVCRICLEAILNAKYTKEERNLKKLIEKCEKKSIISPPIAEKAHQLRELGNNYVHLLVGEIAKELVQKGKVRRFDRHNEDVILMEIGKEEDALKANRLLRDIVKYLYRSTF